MPCHAFRNCIVEPFFTPPHRACVMSARLRAPRSPSAAWRRAEASWPLLRAPERVRVRSVVHQLPASRVRKRARQDALLTHARCHRVGRACAACSAPSGARTEAPEVRACPSTLSRRPRAPEHPQASASPRAASDGPGARPARRCGGGAHPLAWQELLALRPSGCTQARVRAPADQPASPATPRTSPARLWCVRRGSRAAGRGGVRAQR